MKVHKGFVIPMILGLLVSSCSSTSAVPTGTVTDPEVVEPVQEEQNTEHDQLESDIANKDIVIGMLEQQLTDNQIQIDALTQGAEEKDNLIAALQLDNDLLRLRIDQLEAEKLELETLAALTTEIASSEEEESAVIEESLTEEELLTVLKKESQELADTLANAMSQISEQHALSQSYKANWEELKVKLTSLQEQNSTLQSQLEQSEAEFGALQSELSLSQAELSSSKSNLASAQIELKALTLRFNEIEQLLKLKESEGLSIAQAMSALQTQISARLLNVQWRLPSVVNVGETFDVVISANVTPSEAGQSYRAELISSSDIQVIGNGMVVSSVQNGQVQWRWQASGSSEALEAQLSLFVSQDITLQNQTFTHQVYRADDSVALVNNNLLEKYGYWVGAITLSLIVGLFIGLMIGRSRKEDAEAMAPEISAEDNR